MTDLALSIAHDPADVMRRHAHSFAWAAAVLPAPTARDVATLYAFCRMVDDVADTLAPAAGSRALDRISAELEGSHAPGPPVRGFLDLVERHQLPMEPARLLVEGVRSDLRAPRLATATELVRYCHQVAGTVGLLMCPIIGVGERAALPFAVDLGIAMQLTNIARDVIEDAQQGRRYLPAEWLDSPIPPARIAAMTDGVCQRVHEAALQVLALADRYYASADRGMSAIPVRPRGAILVARHVYAAIGARIRTLGPQRYAEGRVMVSAGRKLAPTARAAVALGATAMHRLPAHEAALHAPIAGWPGSNPHACGGVHP
jgi:phytoene synthase